MTQHMPNITRMLNPFRPLQEPSRDNHINAKIKAAEETEKKVDSIINQACRKNSCAIDNLLQVIRGGPHRGRAA